MSGFDPTPPLIEGDFRTRQAIQSAMPLRVAQHVLWHFGDTNLGQQPGKFIERLLLTMSAADLENFAKLEQAFPDYAHAFHAVSRETWGLDWLRTIAREIPFVGDDGA